MATPLEEKYYEKVESIVRDLAHGEAPMCTDGDGMHCAILSCYALLKGPDDNDPTHHVPSCPWRRAKELE